MKGQTDNIFIKWCRRTKNNFKGQNTAKSQVAASFSSSRALCIGRLNITALLLKGEFCPDPDILFTHSPNSFSWSLMKEAEKLKSSILQVGNIKTFSHTWSYLNLIYLGFNEVAFPCHGTNNLTTTELVLEPMVNRNPKWTFESIFFSTNMS